MAEGEEAERELTPLPRHQIASVASPHPRRSVSGGAALFSPLAGETCRGWKKVGADCRARGKGVYNWRRAYAASRRPEEVRSEVRKCREKTR